jgi:Protein of unknown function (DUF3551)
MRKAVWGLMAIGAASAANVVPAAAREYPFCIRGCDYGSTLGDCSFSSYQQCQATASGRLAYCGENPYFKDSARNYSPRISGANAQADRPGHRRH